MSSEQTFIEWVRRINDEVREHWTHGTHALRVDQRLSLSAEIAESLHAPADLVESFRIAAEMAAQICEIPPGGELSVN